MSKESKVIKAIILAGGYSKRINFAIPKQLIKISGKPLLVYTLNTFERCRAIDSIVLVINKRFTRQFQHLIKKYGYRKIEQIVMGGETRQSSVFNALCAINDCDYVIIHDGVRPFVTKEIILNTINAVKKFNAVTCAVRATDTIVEAQKDFIDVSLTRDKLWHIQTPQAFKIDLIFKAHQKARKKDFFNATDDAQLVAEFGNRVRIIEGSYKNIKVTTELDLFLLKKIAFYMF
jgi:2-C-methyl-D-erythritol 4-phosphate cytidylyltransferase